MSVTNWKKAWDHEWGCIFIFTLLLNVFSYRHSTFLKYYVLHTTYNELHIEEIQNQHLPHQLHHRIYFVVEMYNAMDY